METLKRKHAEDPHGQQTKKLRTAIPGSGFGTLIEGCGSVQVAENTPALPLAEVELPDYLSPARSTEEMAIVLYKPTIPELLMSQPIPRAPLVQLDMRLLHADCVLGMLGQESGSASDVFQHWVLRNGAMPGEAPEQPDRASPKVAPGQSSNTRLAVVPWAAHSGSIPISSLFPTEKTAFLSVPSETLKGDYEMVDDNLGSEAMDEDGERAVQSFSAVNTNSNYSPEPWQHYGVPPQPQFGSVMWSH